MPAKKNAMRMSPKPTDLISINMPEGVYDAFKKDFQNGNVTLGNVCSANCFFCSQKWNPPGTTKDLKRLLTIQEIKHFIDVYLNRVEVIGSALHTNSGEFFLHPDATEILNYLADKNKFFINREIFTNGMNLTVEHIKTIKKLNLSLCFSLHSTNVATRAAMMGGSQHRHKNAIDSIEALDKYGVNYQVRIVPLRSTLNDGDLENTMRSLKRSKMTSITIERPGYTKYTPASIAKELMIPDEELFAFALSMRQRYGINVNVAIKSAASKFKDIFSALDALFKNKEYLNIKDKLFLCAEDVENILPLVLRKMEIKNYKIKTVKSKIFGGNINCAGLLLAEDYICAIDEFLEQNKKPEIIFMPGISFDINKEDLSMTPVRKIEDRYKIKLFLISSNGRV